MTAKPRRFVPIVVCVTLVATLTRCQVGELLHSGSETNGPSVPGGGPPRSRVLSLQVVSGSGQSDTVGAVLGSPYLVRVVDQDGRPVPDIGIHWSVVEGKGRLTDADDVTDGSGTAQAVFRLGTEMGDETVRASAEGVDGTVTFNATTRHGAPAAVGFTQEPTDSKVGHEISPAVTIAVRDRYGNPASTYSGTATISATQNNNFLFGTTRRNIVGGVATFDDLRIYRTGSFRLRVVAVNQSTTSREFKIKR